MGRVQLYGFANAVVFGVPSKISWSRIGNWPQCAVKQPLKLTLLLRSGRNTKPTGHFLAMAAVAALRSATRHVPDDRSGRLAAIKIPQPSATISLEWMAFTKRRGVSSCCAFFGANLSRSRFHPVSFAKQVTVSDICINPPTRSFVVTPPCPRMDLSPLTPSVASILEHGSQGPVTRSRAAFLRASLRQHAPAHSGFRSLWPRAIRRTACVAPPMLRAGRAGRRFLRRFRQGDDRQSH